MRNRPRFLLAMLGAACVLLLISCAPQPRLSAIDAEQDGIGGTGIIAGGDEDGVGGTGIHSKITTGEDADGIGGTGLWAGAIESGDVALYGIVTATDPLVLNGHGLVIAENVALSVDGNSMPKSMVSSVLRIGSVAAVRAGIVNGVITAKEIAIEHALIGPIASTEKGVSVLGQVLNVTSKTQWQNISSLDALSTGDFVQVSGLFKNDGSLAASLIGRVEPTSTVLVSGLAVPSEQAAFKVGALSIPQPATEIDAGARIRLWGEFANGHLTVSELRAPPSLPFAGQVTYWSLQGYAHQTANESSANLLRFSGSGERLKFAPSTRATRPELNQDQAVTIDVRLGPDKTPTVQQLRTSAPLDSSSVIIPSYRPSVPGAEMDIHRLQIPRPRPGPNVSTPGPRPSGEAAVGGRSPSDRVPTPRVNLRHPPKLVPRIPIDRPLPRTDVIPQPRDAAPSPVGPSSAGP